MSLIAVSNSMTLRTSKPSDEVLWFIPLNLDVAPCPLKGLEDVLTVGYYTNYEDFLNQRCPPPNWVRFTYKYNWLDCELELAKENYRAYIKGKQNES